jgi:hypothetical protein
MSHGCNQQLQLQDLLYYFLRTCFQNMIRYFLFWLPMILIAFLNATLRELVLNKYFQPLTSHQINTLTLSILCAIYIWTVYPFLKITNKNQALIMGGLWVILTVLFEFSLGLSLGKSWSTLLEQYKITSGQVWILFLFVLSILPYIYYKIRINNPI